MTKKLVLTAVMLFLLAGCGASTETVSDPAGTPADIAAEIIGSQTDIPPMEPLFPSEAAFAAYLSQTYGISNDTFSDGVICYAGGVEASEIAVLAFFDEAAAKTAEDTMREYIEVRADSFAGYVPEQAALVENSAAVRHGRYAALLICADPEAAQTSFLACFEAGWEPTASLNLNESIETLQVLQVLEPERPEAQAAEDTEVAPALVPQTNDAEPAPTPSESSPADEAPSPAPSEAAAGEDTTDTPASDETAPVSIEPVPIESVSIKPAQPVEDCYDKDAVISAWRSGNPESLSAKNQAVYDAASAVISQVITDGMTPYQQELAIHDYITAHCRYDPEANSNAPNAAPDPDNDNPYGMLVNGVGICWGYSSTFQLFMDLLEIECITVDGRSARGDHTWNMVRLDGGWYCVDVTWDDPTGTSPSHRYFNVTSQFLRETNHYWSAAGIPEANSARWAYKSEAS